MFLELIFLAYLAVHSGYTSHFSENSDFLSREKYASAEQSACPTNSSISLKVFRNLRGEWLTTYVRFNKLRNLARSIDINLEKNLIECGNSRYVMISGFLADKDAGNSSWATVGDRGNSGSDGEASGANERIPELTSKAEDSILINNTRAEKNNELKNFHRIIKQTMKSLERKLNDSAEILAGFTKTFNNIERILNELQELLNATKKFYTADEEIPFSTTAEPFSNNPYSSDAEGNTTTQPTVSVSRCSTCPDGTIEMEQFKFDDVYKGRKIHLSSDLRTATRTRPIKDDGYYGGVITNFPIEDDQVFEIKIEETIGNWKDEGLALGVILKKEEGVKEKWSIFNNVKGTWSIQSGWYNSKSGKSDTFKDGEEIGKDVYPLQTHRLPVGTILGILRRANGDLHFLINGDDRGVAFSNVTKGVFAFVDVMLSVTKISIVN